MPDSADRKNRFRANPGRHIERTRIIVYTLIPATSLPYLKYVLPAITALLVIVYATIGNRSVGFLRGIMTATLFACALLAMQAYTTGNRHGNLWLNSYEFYHYYIGAKYASELGYTNMYNATVVADAETNPRRIVQTVRDLDSERIVSVDNVLRARAKYKALFSESRWKEFTQDIKFFHDRASNSQWQQQLRDKGYNATPLWTVLGGSLSNAVSTASQRGMQALVLIDVALLLIACLCVLWAFGHRAALLLLIFMGTHYLMSHNTLRAAFLRLDWIACLVMAVCMLKKDYCRIAGALTAWAALSRIFPAIFAFGVGALFLFDLVFRRQLNRRCFSYCASLGVAAAILFGLSVWYSDGLGAWREFFEKVSQHNEDISAWRIGFKYVFLMTYDSALFWGVTPDVFFQEHRTLWWGIQGLVFLFCFVSIGGLQPYEALALGFVPVYFFFAPTYYYYVFLMIPMLFFAGKIERPLWTMGLVYIFATGIVGHICFGWWDRGFRLFFVMSCLMGILAIYMLILALIQAVQRRRCVPAAETQGISHAE